MTIEVRQMVIKSDLEGSKQPTKQQGNCCDDDEQASQSQRAAAAQLRVLREQLERLRER